MWMRSLFRWSISALCALILGTAALALMSGSASAQGIYPFGGKIIRIQACKTPPGLMLTIGPPVAGQYLLAPSTIIFSYGAFIPGTWVLGNAAPAPVVCKGSRSSLGGFSVGGVGGGGGLAGSVGSAVVSAAISSAIPGIPSIGLPIGGIPSLGLPGIGSIFGSLGVSFGSPPPIIGSPRPIIIIGTGAGPSL